VVEKEKKPKKKIFLTNLEVVHDFFFSPPKKKMRGQQIVFGNTNLRRVAVSFLFFF
jgi:hypothetical protein